MSTPSYSRIEIFEIPLRHWSQPALRLDELYHHAHHYFGANRLPKLRVSPSSSRVFSPPAPEQYLERGSIESAPQSA